MARESFKVANFINEPGTLRFLTITIMLIIIRLDLYLNYAPVMSLNISTSMRNNAKHNNLNLNCNK